ncbi:TetR family transcriptional regulator [candidate division GN15 bacterium]|nr:TetR family transcriptional regulator [candidate division GN15 bacterium]
MLNENLIAELVHAGVVTDTFRRLPPEKKEQVYQRGVELFGKYGYDGLSVDRICRDCAISKGSFFQYFPSKTNLLEFCLVVFDDNLAAWIAEIRRKEQAALARDRLGYLYHEIVVNSKLHRPEQTFYLFATRGLKHAGVVIEGIDPERHFREYIAEIIERGEQTGEIRGDFDIEQTAYLVSVIIDGIVARRFSERAPIGSGLGEYLISFLFDGIKA